MVNKQLLVNRKFKTFRLFLLYLSSWHFSVFFRHIVKTEGPKALFKGLVPNIVGVAPSRAIYFGAYAQSKKFFNTVLNPDTPIVHVLSASFAGKNRFRVWFIIMCVRLNVWSKLVKWLKNNLPNNNIFGLFTQY